MTDVLLAEISSKLDSLIWLGTGAVIGLGFLAGQITWHMMVEQKRNTDF